MAETLPVYGVGRGEVMVYQLLDCDGTPIYIGQTNNIGRRLIEHSREKEWFSEVKGVWYEFADAQRAYRDGAYYLERARILQFMPRYNQKPGRSQKFNEPVIGVSCIIPVKHRDQLYTLAEQRGVGPADLVREAIAMWLTTNASEIAAALSAPAEETRVAV